LPTGGPTRDPSQVPIDVSDGEGDAVQARVIADVIAVQKFRREPLVDQVYWTVVVDPQEVVGQNRVCPVRVAREALGDGPLPTLHLPFQLLLQRGHEDVNAAAGQAEKPEQPGERPFLPTAMAKPAPIQHVDREAWSSVSVEWATGCHPLFSAAFEPAHQGSEQFDDGVHG
jgi:hypothetical protein